MLHADIDDVKDLAKPLHEAKLPMDKIADQVSDDIITDIKCLHRLVITPTSTM